ncbi:MAG: SurA N-terminal domain-containing protein [Desulfobacterales bacterium]
MKPLAWILISFVFFTCYSCNNLSAKPEKHYLVRVDNEILTVSDFTRAFEIAKMGYPNDAVSEPETLYEIRIRLLNEMTEELIIINRAKELGISICDQTLENEIWKFQKDYPDGTFEEVLLENAIPYSYWKECLRRKLLKDRVIYEELEKNMTVTSREIRFFYENHFGEAFTEPEDETKAMAFSQKIIRQLHKEKAKELYPSWIKSLWKHYGVEINQTAWNKITGS